MLNQTACSSQTQIDALFPKFERKVAHEFVQATFREKLLRWIVDSDQPHTEVERKSFIALLKYCNPELTVVGADALKKDLMLTYEKMQGDLKTKMQAIQSKISFTHDAWTSPNHVAFIAIKAHWISQTWEMNEVLLNFPQVKGRHTGENVYEIFQTDIKNFGIGLEKVQAITMDNASNNDTFFNQVHMAAAAQDNEISMSIGRIRCSAHVLNLAVQSLMSHLRITPATVIYSAESDSEIGDHDNLITCEETKIISKLGILVRMVRKSTQRRMKLQEACRFHGLKELELIIDAKTRWNSTFYMIQRAIDLKVPIFGLCSSDNTLKNLIISESEWSLLKSIKQLLEKFDRATQHLSMTRHPTISSVIPMYDWLKAKLYEFKSNSAGSLKLAASKAYDKLVEYEPTLENSAILYIAVILRPSLKLNYFQQHSELYDSSMTKRIKSLVVATFEKHYEAGDVVEPPTAVDCDQDLDDDFHAHMSKRSRKEKKQSEIQRYLAGQFASTRSNTLDWWKVHAAEFPNVAKMAMDILAVQSTSVPVERESSGGVDLITPTRHSLSPATITASMCMKSWWK